MLSVQDNIYLTQVGAGTPGGELHRRYWQPIAATSTVVREEVVPVRVLGEDLVLYRARSGKFGLVQQRCPHRSALLQNGWVDEEGIRCPYHGWYFNGEGRCLAQPYDDLNGQGTFKDRVTVTAYPVQELGGLVWAYLGPDPAPLLPRWEALVEGDVAREIAFTLLPCNWLQIAENTMDPVHVEWLHVNQSNHAAVRRGEPPLIESRRHLKVDFAPFAYGIYKRRLMEGDPIDSIDWTVGHPLLFPATLAQHHAFQFRVPVDDTHTLHILYRTYPADHAVIGVKQLPIEPVGGESNLESVLQQDFSAWISQGPLTPRHLEALCRSDRGISMLRTMLRENIEAVARGEDPVGVIRDPSVNDPFIELAFEGELSAHQTRLTVLAAGS